MNEQIKELAKEAGFWFFDYDVARCDVDEIERFAELVRQDEREACAKLCDARGGLHGGLFGNWAQDISERIRGRGLE